MWSLISSNRILDRKIKQEAHQRHLKNIRNVRSQVNNSTPKKFSFLYTRPKARQLQFQRQRNIQTNNTLLVQRMLYSNGHVKSKDAVFMKDSLNNTYNRKKQRQIDIDNQSLVRRLQNACSQYSQIQINKSTKKYLQFRSNMANSRMDPWYDLQVSKKIQNPSQRPASAKR